MYSANITCSSGEPFLDVPNSADHLKKINDTLLVSYEDSTLIRGRTIIKLNNRVRMEITIVIRIAVSKPHNILASATFQYFILK